MMARRILLLVILTGVLLGAPTRLPEPTVLRWIDRNGVDKPCPPSRATVVMPDRDRFSMFALFEDLAYAAAEGGGEGAAALLLLLAFPITLFGLWCRGFGCALRRLWVTISLGVPLGVALLYASCFLPGRGIQLESGAGDVVLANLHTTTNYSTGFMSPAQLRDWHFAHRVTVLNVADRDQIEGAREAARYNFERPVEPRMTVVVGHEWRAHPDMVLVNVDRLWEGTDADRAAIFEGVRKMGGASFAAHPWDRMDGTNLAAVLNFGADGAELVNGVINGGREVIDAAHAHEPPRALLGVTDPKFGPHLHAITLIPRNYSRSPRGVATAIRKGLTEVLYAVPGGTVSSRERASNPLWTFGLLPALYSLAEAPFGRRVVWLLTLVLMLGLWWISIHSVKTPRLRARWAHLMFWGSGVVLLGGMFGLSWEVRSVLGPVSVTVQLLSVAPFAVTLLASAHHLALHQEQPEEPAA